MIECGVAVFDQLKQGIGKIEFLSDPTTGEVRIGCVPSKAGDPSSISHPPICVGWATRIKSIGSNAKIRLGSRAAISPIADTAGGPLIAAGSAAVRRRRANSGLMQCVRLRLHSITSSASVRSLSGTSSPSALAVLRLITSSNLVERRA